MTKAQWHISGQYLETCNCDYLCPCLESKSTAQPTKGDCIAAMAFRIDQGTYGDMALDGLCFVVVLHTPGPMSDGGWTLGVIIDERANDEQRAALQSIGSGNAGGRPARLAMLTEHFAGVEYCTIRFDGGGMKFSVSADELLDQAVEGVPGVNPEEPMFMGNVAHPANNSLSLAKASRSHVHAFGIDFDDVSGQNNGHFSPFDWQGP